MTQMDQAILLITGVINHHDFFWSPEERETAIALIRDEVVVPGGQGYKLGPKYIRVSTQFSDNRARGVFAVWRLNQDAQSPEEAEAVRELLRRQGDVSFYRHFLGLNHMADGLEIQTTMGTFVTRDLKTMERAQVDTGLTCGTNKAGHILPTDSDGGKRKKR